jgi:HK97 gp10 family phage protein
MAIQIIGLKEANRALKRLPDYAKSEAQQAMNMTAFHIARFAEHRAPRRSGLLRSRIQWEARPRSVSAVVGVRPDAYYWKFVEYGTKRMEARPFLRPAAESQAKEHGPRLLAALEKAADHVERDHRSATSGLI